MVMGALIKSTAITKSLLTKAFLTLLHATVTVLLSPCHVECNTFADSTEADIAKTASLFAVTALTITADYAAPCGTSQQHHAKQVCVLENSLRHAARQTKQSLGCCQKQPLDGIAQKCSPSSKGCRGTPKHPFFLRQTASQQRTLVWTCIVDSVLPVGCSSWASLATSSN